MGRPLPRARHLVIPSWPASLRSHAGSRITCADHRGRVHMLRVVRHRHYVRIGTLIVGLPHMGNQSNRNQSKSTARTVGQLCVGGDWACAHGELEALGDVAERLADYTREPLHHALVELSMLCRRDPQQATALWTRLKPQVLRDVTPAS